MYNIEYELRTYEKLQEKIKQIVNDENKYSVTKCEDLGKSPCGFPIEHYKIGNGPIHIAYMGGCHGNEIISKEYYLAFREDDINVTKTNKFLNSFLENFNISDPSLTTNFWIYFQNKDITIEGLFMYFVNHYEVNHKELITFLQTNFTKTISKERNHTKIFNDLTFDCIPELSDSHKLLKEKVKKLYKENSFPIGSLANFYANSDGVNLNDNNPYYYEIMKQKIAASKVVLGNIRDNHITKSVPGPIGNANYDMNKPFCYSSENEAIFKYLNNQDENRENFAFFNCHGTGGLLYIYPVYNGINKSEPRDFSFYINNRLATEYTNETGNAYLEKTGKFDPYKTAGHPSQITGVGDVLRKKYIASFILELSKMGGNPLAPYGDRENNYTLTMQANFDAFSKTLKTILSLQELYETSYTMLYDDFGQVHYETSSRGR